MSLIWGPSKKRFAQFAVLALMAGELSSLAAQVLVLRSIGPSARRYPAGQRLPDNASFALRPGDSVVVLARGATRTFRGPGTFNASSAVRVGGIAGAPGQVRRQTGAVRGDGDNGPVLRPADVWQYDVTQSGRACILAGRRPILWRPSAERAVRLTITPPTGAAQTINWARGRTTLEWPANVPLVNGASYQLSWTGGTSPTRLTARTIAALPLDNVEAVATALLSNECRGQLDVLIATRDAGDDGRLPAGSGARGGAPAPR
ncbi:MAG TPA: hypothetical protein VGB54_00705 [Allosphingosinicella sp.]